MKFWDKYKKTLDTKQARISVSNRIYILYKNTTVHHSKSKLCNRIFDLKKYYFLKVEKFACPFRDAIKLELT